LAITFKSQWIHVISKKVKIVKADTQNKKREDEMKKVVVTKESTNEVQNQKNIITDYSDLATLESETIEYANLAQTKQSDTPKQFVAMKFLSKAETAMTRAAIEASRRINRFRESELVAKLKDERGDVPGWVLVVLMTTGLVTAIWTIAAPRLTAILKGSLDAMNGIR